MSANPIEEQLFAIAQDGDRDAMARILMTVEPTSDTRAIAWRVLGESCDRATSGQSIKRGRDYYRREIRQLGNVVAWREARMTEQRVARQEGAIELRVLDSVEAANRLIDEELGASSCDWGVRPRSDELKDITAHRKERERLIRGADLDGLEAYRRRYDGKRILSRGGDGRLFASAPWTVDELLVEAVSLGSAVEVIAFALAMNPSEEARRMAAEQAIRGGHLAILSRLLENLDDVDVVGRRGTLLAIAAHAGNAAAVRALLEKRASPNQVSNAAMLVPPFERAAADGDGPMVNAVRNADAEILRLLLGAGGDPFSKTFAKRRVVDLANELGNSEIVAMLAEATAMRDVPADMETAIANGDLARIHQLLPIEGSAKAIAACGFKENVAILQAVLEAGVPHDRAVLAKALWASAGNGHRATVALLLAHGADPNGYAGSLGTARKFAETNGHGAIVEMLKKAGGKLRLKA